MLLLLLLLLLLSLLSLFVVDKNNDSNCLGLLLLPLVVPLGAWPLVGLAAWPLVWPRFERRYRPCWEKDQRLKLRSEAHGTYNDTTLPAWPEDSHSACAEVQHLQRGAEPEPDRRRAAPGSALEASARGRPCGRWVSCRRSVTTETDVGYVRYLNGRC